jgi:ribonuclease HI
MARDICINPGGMGVTHTNNRAELVAIAVALEAGAAAIATDSLVGIRLIRKAIYRPWTLTHHVHKELLEHIVALIDQHPSNAVHLYKVKSHAGVIGNVNADQCADDAADRIAAGHQCDANIRIGEQPFAAKYWPKVKMLPSHADLKIQPDGWQLQNVREDLRAHMTAIHRLGHSNVDSIYYQAWHSLISTTDGQASNHHMTSKEVTHRQRRILLQYRTGTLPTNKLLHRWKLSPTDQCPMCGQPDGGHHALSGCPKIAQGVAANRHHCAGRRILQALLDGGRGANVAMADVGSRTKMMDEGLDDIDSCLPAWLFNQQHVGAAEVQAMRRRFKPDALLVLNGDQDPNPGARNRDMRTRLNGMVQQTITTSTRIYIVEVKYCSDTQPGLRFEAATKQHAVLASTLRDMWGCTVEIIPLMLGVGGSIFASTKESLELLGVKDMVYHKLARELNVLAAQFAEKAWNYRQANASDEQRLAVRRSRWEHRTILPRSNVRARKRPF